MEIIRELHGVKLRSKIPEVGTTIFTVMSSLAAESGAINLGQGFPNFDCPQELKDLINHYLQEGKNQYAPMPGLPALNQVLSEKILSLYDCPLDPETEITITAGGTQALYTSIDAFVHPGDEVILIEPAYDSYRPSILAAGGKPVPVELRAPDFKVDWNELSDAVTDKTAMIIINTPQNPIGKVFRRDDIIALQDITRNTSIIVLSDEVYEHLVYDDLSHESVLRYPELRHRSLAVFSFGKTFHATGWKIGYITGAESLMKEFRKIHQFNVFSVNSFIQYALADYLKDPIHYLELPDFFQRKRDLFNQAMSESRLRPLKSEGTYFQLFDYSQISDENDLDFSKRLTKMHGVACIPVSVFYSSARQDHVIRLCFAKTDEMLLQGGERLSRL